MPEFNSDWEYIGTYLAACIQRIAFCFIQMVYFQCRWVGYEDTQNTKARWGIPMKHKFLYITALLSCTLLDAQWASLFHKKVTPQEAMVAQHQNRYFFCQEQVPLFTQLIFSWNAIRPPKGYFEFFVQARNEQTKKWGVWHRALRWGRGIQSSHATSSDGFTKYEHVRLETEHAEYADAFRLKVVGRHGASCANLKAVSITTINMRQFRTELLGGGLMQLPSVYLSRVPELSQMAVNHKDNKRICSPVSCTMLTQYLMGSPIDPIAFANASYDTGFDAYGNWAFNVASAFEFCKGRYWFFHTRLNSFTDLHKQLMRGIPAVVSVRGELPGAPQSYPHGHLLVVVGWDNKSQRVICHDPAMGIPGKTMRAYRLKDFVKAWEQSRRLAYVATYAR